MLPLRKSLPTLAVVTGLLFTPAERVHADSGDFIAGIAAGVIGAAIVGNAKKKRKTYRKTYRNPAVRGDANIQRALNAFGFDAGRPDGLFGKRTRAAIRRYQGRRGDEVSGYLTATQRAELLQAYARLGATNSGDVFGTGNGGGQPAPGGVGGTTVAAVGTGASMAGFLATLGSNPTTTPAPTAPVTATAFNSTSEAASQQPAPAPDTPLVARLCDHPAVAQSSEIGARNGAESATNVFAQSFCTARSYALAASADLVGQSPTFDPVTAREGCAAYADQQAATMQQLMALPAAAAAADLSARMNTGSPEQTAAIRNNFSVCLGLAQADGDMERALTYATLMVGLGEGAYGELVAEQHGLGLGTAQNPEAAVDWLNYTVGALDGDAPALVDVADYDHGPLLLALAETAPGLTQDAAGYLSAIDQAPAPGAVGGLGTMAFPNILDSGAAQKQKERDAKTAAMAPVLTAPWATIYGQEAATLLATCKGGETAQHEIGLRTCAALAWAMGDHDFAEAMDSTVTRAAAR
ncbi:MAG: peptidoglycan-binding domain-containing protein [Pseudomonadota bacterium]